MSHMINHLWKKCSAFISKAKTAEIKVKEIVETTDTQELLKLAETDNNCRNKSHISFETTDKQKLL